MRHAVAAVVCVSALVAPRALAQHCHVPAPIDTRGLGMQASVIVDFASYRTARYEGEYQGLALGIAWEHRWVRLRASLPGYRLVRNGQELYGLGDLLLDVRTPFARTQNDTLVVGAGLAATLPTGDASRGLGMGHVMMMPGLWATFRLERVFLLGQVSYGHAIGADGTHHGGGPAPLVNPMNVSEVELAIIGGVGLIDELRLRGGLYGAVPVAAPAGAPRAVVFLGLDVIALGWLDLSVEAHLPVAGDPFTAKLILLAAARF